MISVVILASQQYSPDPYINEKILYETFSRFGPLIAAPKVSRDDANLSKNYGFISYASFDSSDEAISNMNGQFLMNREITVQYAYNRGMLQKSDCTGLA